MGFLRWGVAALWMIGLVAETATAQTEGARPGDFTHYVLALSWSPSWCEIEGDARGADQCRRGAGHGFTLHGLWPQGETGWPQYCRTSRRDPSRAMTGAMADIMGAGGLAWHQWKKHGRCADLSAADYFALSRAAYDSVTRPAVLRRLKKAVRLDPQVVEDAFLEANPTLGDDMMATRCRDGRFYELRICLDRDLSPRRCSQSTRKDCMYSAKLPPRR